jgi:hypothetical protein
MGEADFRNRRARHIVYGHTHQHEIIPLDASHADGYVLNQTYFNAGSCRRGYQPTPMLAGNHELCACDTFSLLCFYNSDERSGRTYETWSGTLAPAMIEMAATEMTSAPTAMTSAPAAAPIRAPQFAGNLRSNMARSY